MEFPRGRVTLSRRRKDLKMIPLPEKKLKQDYRRLRKHLLCPIAAIHLLKALEEQTSIETTGDILRVLGEIKSEHWKAPLSMILIRYLSHDHPKLRAQALHTLCQIEGTGAEDIFLKSLHDSSVEVRKRAVWCLGMIKSPRGIERMMDSLEKASRTPPSQEDPVETQIYHALGLVGNVGIKGRTIEQIPLDVLEKRGIKQWWNPFQKTLLNESSLGAICDTLGKIGTPESNAAVEPVGKGSRRLLGSEGKRGLEKD